MDERLLTRLRGAGFEGELIGSLDSSEAAFALSDTSLAFVDAAGARQVALRDINRIHSDREGVLRVETAGGTAITASLLGFDPAGVQGFFNEVRIATNTAKQLPQAPHAMPVSQGPWKSGWSSLPNTPPVSQPPLGDGPADNAVTTPLSTAAQGPDRSPSEQPGLPPVTSAQATPAPAVPATPPADRPSSQSHLQTVSLPDPEERVTVLPQTPTDRPEPAQASAPTPPSRPAPKPVVISTAPRYNPEPETLRPAPSKPASTEPRKPPQPTRAAPTPKPEVSAPVPATPARETPAPRPPAPTGSLLALADSVERLSGTLRLLALAMGLAAILIGILRFRDGDTITGLWILGSGVIAAFALLVFAQVARLMVAVARRINQDS